MNVSPDYPSMKCLPQRCVCSWPVYSQLFNGQLARSTKAISTKAISTALLYLPRAAFSVLPARLHCLVAVKQNNHICKPGERVQPVDPLVFIGYFSETNKQTNKPNKQTHSKTNKDTQVKKMKVSMLDVICIIDN